MGQELGASVGLVSQDDYKNAPVLAGKTHEVPMSDEELKALVEAQREAAKIRVLRPKLGVGYALLDHNGVDPCLNPDRMPLPEPPK